MLAANTVSAISLALSDGSRAVLVQEGHDWNGVRKFVCISPARHEGQTIIAVRSQQRSTTASVGSHLDADDQFQWVVVMASPDLCAVDCAQPAPESSPDAGASDIHRGQIAAAMKATHDKAVETMAKRLRAAGIHV